VLTDPRRKVRGEGRPYAVLDGRLPEQLAHIFSSRDANVNGWLFIDGGGNRPDFDSEIARNVDLTLVPFRDSEEDLDAVVQSLAELPNSLALPYGWPTNPLAIKASDYLIDGLGKAFPLRVMHPPIPSINSSKELLADTLHSPTTIVRSAARKVFQTMLDYYASHPHRTATNHPALHESPLVEKPG
jgi:hypothetical protein